MNCITVSGTSLYTITYKKIGDQEETNDLLQEMFIELWEKRGETLNINNTVKVGFATGYGLRSPFIQK